MSIPFQENFVSPKPLSIFEAEMRDTLLSPRDDSFVYMQFSLPPLSPGIISHGCLFLANQPRVSFILQLCTTTLGEGSKQLKIVAVRRPYDLEKKSL